MGTTKSSKNKNQQINSSIDISKKNDSVYFESITLFFIVAFLCIDFLPTFRSIEIIGTQYLYLAILNTIIGIWFYNNPSIIPQNLISFYKKKLAIKFYLVFLLLCGISLFFAKNISLGIVSLTSLIIIFFTFINLIILLNNRLNLIYKIAFLIGISVFIRSFIELRQFSQIASAESIVNALNKLKGNTGNINILSASLSIKIPFLFLGIFYFKKWGKWFLVLTLLITTTLLFLSGSRAAYLSLFIETVLFILIFLKFKSIFNQERSNILYLIIPILFSFFIANQIFKKSNDIGRYQSVTSRIEQTTNLKDASVNDRFNLWNNALIMIQKNPITGIGLGNWKIESIPYEKTTTNDHIISNHPHNDFLEISTETGVLNGFIYLSLFIILVYLNLKTILKSDKQDSKIIAIVSLLTILTYGIDAIFNFPLYRPTMQLSFCLFFALTLLNSSDVEELIENKSNKNISIFILLISLITVFFSFKTFKAYQLENDINVDFVTHKITLRANDIVANLPEFPNVLSTGEAFSTYAGKYFLEEQNYKQAFIYLNKGDKINPYQGRTDYYKSLIATNNNKNDSAYIYAKRALDIRPRNKIYYTIAINTALVLKDTLEILKVHKIYTQYNNAPDVWINTSSALNQSNYGNNKLINFIDKGLKIFPGDSLLLERKRLFQNSSFMVSAGDFFINKKYDQAINAYKKALNQDPSNGILMQNIGLCYFNLKKYNNAIPYFENSLKAKIENNGKSEYFLGICYYNLKQVEKGCEYMNLAKNKNYSNSNEIVKQSCK
nr:O-antigen ligase family protein [uncultured Flavobacterium sp.]